MPNDHEIWRNITQGDAAAFDVFYRENAPRLQAFLRQIVGSRQGAEDVTQETFISLWTRPIGYEPERGSLRAYVFGMARKRAAGWWRKQGPSDALTDNATGASRDEVRSIVGDAFHRLPEEQQTLLWLREVEGYSYEELSGMLDIPVGTVRSRLFAAREALRTIWQSKPQDTAQKNGRGAA